MENRDFKGVWIDKSVWLDERLNAIEKVILVEIDSLCGEQGCYASNEYLAEFCQCSTSKVSHTISKLVDLGYISIKSFDGRKRVLQSRLANFARQNSKKCKADTQNLQHNNIDKNTNNNKDDIKKEKTSKKTSYDKIIDEMIEDEEIKELMYDFIKMRKAKKKPLTDRALKIQINKLFKITEDIEEQKAIIEKSIVKCWDEFYKPNNGGGYNGVQRNIPTAGDEYAMYD